MIYDIRHVTSYSYESSVSFARCALRLEPKTGDGQVLISHAIDIRPRPAERAARRDFYGTLTESVLIETAHKHLRIDSRSRVAVERRTLDRSAQSPACVHSLFFDRSMSGGTVMFESLQRRPVRVNR